MTKRLTHPSAFANAMLVNTALGFASNQPGHVSLDPRQIRRDPAAAGALDQAGNLIVHEHRFWQEFNQTEISYFCVNHGFYCIPTVELVEWLEHRIAGRVAIEIGAGSGVLAAALGIQATDNRMQEWPAMARAYQSIGQAPVRYGANVDTVNAAAAIKRYKPEVVIAAWVTHKYRPHEAWRKGNEYGVEEEKLITKVQSYIHIGHSRVHEAKPILDLKHSKIEPPWLVSRAMGGGHNFIAWWGE